MNPLISVIIPNYNHALYLKERIESVLNQTYDNFEVIILDDLSTDNSREIIEQYRNHPKVSQIVYNEKNSGSTFKQWEKGINLAKGEWIWIAESDDFCENNLLESLLLPIEKHTNISFSYCQSYVLYPNNRLYLHYQFCPENEIVSGDNFLNKELIPYNNVYNASMVIFRKSNFYKISKEYTKYKFGGDWIFWAEMCKLGDVNKNIRPLNYFRKQGGQDVTGTTFKTGLNYIEDLNALLYFRDKLNCNHKKIIIAIKNIYFNFLKKKNELPKQNQQTVLKHFKFIFGSKRLWIWNLKFSKHKALKYCYDIFKEM